MNLLNPLSLIPAPYQLAARAIALLVLAALAFATGWTVNGWRLGTDLQALKAEHAQTVAMAAEVSRRAEAAQRAEEARREQEKTHAIQEAQSRAAAAAADARRADAAAGSLREQLAAFVARARAAGADPGAGAGSASTGDATGVLAELFGRVEQAGRAMAAEADRRRIAGEACERSYDSLTHP